MTKSLQISAIILIGLIFIAMAYLLSTYWSNYKVIPVALVSYASFISLILLKDKTKLFDKTFEWMRIKFFSSSRNLIIVNLFLLIVLLFVSWTGFKQYARYNYNAYITVYENNSANYKTNEQAELLNLITKERIIVSTDETGRGIFHVDVPSVWQKTYQNYRFPEEKVESIPYGFKINLSTIKNEAVAINDITKTKSQDIGIFQMPKEYLNRSSVTIINSKRFSSYKYLLAGISNLESFVERKGYIINYNGLLKVPFCVAYRIFLTQNSDGRRDNKRFYIDTELRSSSPSAFLGSGYDFGHLISVSDMLCYGDSAVRNTYLTSAIAPQAPKMNRGIWKSLEDYTRKFADDTIYVIAGTLFLNTDDKGISSFSVIGDEKVAVPTHFYRIISRKIHGSIESLAFVIPNNNSVEEDISKYLVSVKDIENNTRLIFFSDLPPSQQKFKEIVPTKIWETK